MITTVGDTSPTEIVASRRNYKLGPLLTESCEAFLSQPRDKQISLREELALSRDYLTNFINMYSLAKENYARVSIDPERTIEEKNKAWAMLVSAGEEMQARIERVTKVAQAAGRLEEEDQLFTVLDIQDVVSQMVDILARQEGLSSQRLHQTLDANLRLPGTAKHTDITPDKTVIDMHSTIPAAPQKGENGNGNGHNSY